MGWTPASSFPGSPSTNDLFYRTDRALIYYYTGSQWLTVNEYSQPLVLLDGPFAPQTSNGAIMYGPVDQGANGCWVTRHVVDVIQLAGDGSNYWTLQLQSRPASGAGSNVGGTVVTNGYTNGNRVRTETTVGAAVTGSHADFMLNATETGSAASLYAMIVVYYRLIALKVPLDYLRE